MKVVIPLFVKKDFDKKCSFFHNLFDLIYRKFKKEKIYLKRPFLKIKINICNKSYRILAYYKSDIDLLLIVGIYHKKDKDIGYNLTRNSIKDRIDVLFQKTLEAIKNENYLEKEY